MNCDAAALPARLRAAAEVLEEISALTSFNPELGMWNARSLRREAEVLEKEGPC